MHTNIALLFVKYNYNLYQIKYSLIFINYLSNVTNMNGMFVRAYAFNQDLSGWCVVNIQSEPNSFAADSALTNANKPVWGRACD